jgi:glutathione S-transferase
MLYHTGTFYPVLTRATYPTLGFPQYAGEVGPSEASDELKAQAVKDATNALADPLAAFEKFFLRDRKFIGGDRPSIADIRFAASFEFLRVIDYPFSARVEQFLSDMEETLGEAYSEPAADVRGFVASVKAPA